MKKTFQKKFFGSEILEGHYYDYINDVDSDASWERYSRKIIEGEAKRVPGFFDNMECPEGVPEDICKIAFAAGGNEYLNARLGLFDGYTVLEILKHCKHGEIIVRGGLQTLHW